jgi:N-terminal acetyltransferase B complex non-catalytic subunit
MRGPYLARLQMHKKMRDLKLDANALLGDYQELLIDYFRLFGNKKCCTNDLKIFLDYLDIEKRIEFAAKLVRDSAITSTSLPQNVSIFQSIVFLNFN